jgi:hypothetical protein
LKQDNSLKREPRPARIASRWLKPDRDRYSTPDYMDFGGVDRPFVRRAV